MPFRESHARASLYIDLDRLQRRIGRRERGFARGTGCEHHRGRRTLVSRRRNDVAPSRRDDDIGDPGKAAGFVRAFNPEHAPGLRESVALNNRMELSWLEQARIDGNPERYLDRRADEIDAGVQRNLAGAEEPAR